MKTQTSVRALNTTLTIIGSLFRGVKEHGSKTILITIGVLSMFTLNSCDEDTSSTSGSSSVGAPDSFIGFTLSSQIQQGSDACFRGVATIRFIDSKTIFGSGSVDLKVTNWSYQKSGNLGQIIIQHGAAQGGAREIYDLIFTTTNSGTLRIRVQVPGQGTACDGTGVFSIQ